MKWANMFRKCVFYALQTNQNVNQNVKKKKFWNSESFWSNVRKMTFLFCYFHSQTKFKKISEVTKELWNCFWLFVIEKLFALILQSVWFWLWELQTKPTKKERKKNFLFKKLIQKNGFRTYLQNSVTRKKMLQSVSQI